MSKRIQRFSDKGYGEIEYTVLPKLITITQSGSRIYIPLADAKKMGSAMLVDGACAEWTA